MPHTPRALPLGLAALAVLTSSSPCLGGDAAPEAAGLLPPVIPRALVYESWTAYKERFIQGDGRVIDRKGGGISTSEGQSYALVRALWLDDRATFDRVLAWSEANLRTGTRDDHLYSWKWGQAEDGAWKVLDPTSAADAEVLTAWALLGAERRWHEPAYLSQGRAILDDLWRLEVRELAGRRYLLPGDWRDDQGPALRINPSYYMPFAFRAFAAADPTHPWGELVDTSYHVFERCRSEVGLPVDWCQLDRATGELRVGRNVYDSASDFAYEAFRVLWTLAADHRWFGEARAAALLRDMDWLQRYWIVRRELPQVVTADGIPRNPYPYLGMYGAVLPAMSLLDPLEADILYQMSLAPTYNHGVWSDPEDYYLQNWVWFGLALQSPIPAPLPVGERHQAP